MLVQYDVQPRRWVFLLTRVSRQRGDIIQKVRMSSEDTDRLEEAVADGRLTLIGLLKLRGRNECHAVVYTARNI
jgi:hypothetical protein